MASPSARRLQKELAEMRTHASSTLKITKVDEANLLHWEVMLYPEREPYNKGAFKVTVDFPADYPFKPPRLTFTTKIYHPNVDDKGQVCIAIVAAENWKPATRIEQVMNALVLLIGEPQIDHPLRADLAEEYQKDKPAFFKKAEEFTKKHAEKRT